MISREEYLRYSDECLRLAQAATEPHARTRLLEMAQAWRELADKRNFENDPSRSE